MSLSAGRVFCVSAFGLCFEFRVSAARGAVFRVSVLGGAVFRVLAFAGGLRFVFQLLLGAVFRVSAFAGGCVSCFGFEGVKHCRGLSRPWRPGGLGLGDLDLGGLGGLGFRKSNPCGSRSVRVKFASSALFLKRRDSRLCKGQ